MALFRTLPTPTNDFLPRKIRLNLPRKIKEKKKKNYVGSETTPYID